MTTWWTSDEHYGHANIIGFCDRPFADADEMREELIRRHNERVRPGDDVWHLGDFSMNPHAVPALLRRLNGRHRLIAGNHDRCHSCHKRHEREKRYYLRAGFVDVCESVSLGIDGNHRIWHACHMPSAGGPDTRYPDHRPDPRDFDVLLHGHVHQHWKLRTFEHQDWSAKLEGFEVPSSRKILLNVGVDVHDFAPISQEELRALVASAI